MTVPIMSFEEWSAMLVAEEEFEQWAEARSIWNVYGRDDE